MLYYDSDALFVPSIAIFFIGLVMVYAYSKRTLVSLGVAFVKAAVFFIYFYFFFDGTFTFKDDWTYLNAGNELLAKGFSIFSIVTDRETLMNMFRSRHILYQVYNLLAFKLFGENYFSPVALNIIVTFFTSYLLYKFALLLKLSKQLSLYIAILYLIHWDILAWSSFLNLKDILVQFLVFLAIYSLMKIVYEHRYKFSISFIISLYLLAMIRFYLILAIAITYMIYMLCSIYIRNKRLEQLFILSLVPVLITLVFVTVTLVYPSDLNFFLDRLTNPLTGSIRFLLTPIPFHIDNNYLFLTFSALLHWVMFPFMIYGYFVLYKKSPNTTIFITLFVFTILIIYGSIPELQTARKRLILEPFFVIFQMLGVVSFGRDIRLRNLKMSL